MQDNSWEQFGKNDPYWAVLTEPQFKAANLNDTSLNMFFETGEVHVNEVLSKFKMDFSIESLSEKNALDFGCGTGRNLIPIAKHFKNVVGVDISEAMLKEAKKNIDEREISNITLLQNDDITKTNFPTDFDFVHSFIVLQHIPQETGYKIIEKLISLVKEGGFGMIHFTFFRKENSWKKVASILKKKYKLIRQVVNILEGKTVGAPHMQMNNYDLVKIFNIFIKYKVNNLNLSFTDHGGFLGACVYFKK